MKEPAQAINKCFALIGNLIHKVKPPMVLSKRSLATSFIRLGRDHAF
jgi:hypothetical protein